MQNPILGLPVVVSIGVVILTVGAIRNNKRSKKDRGDKKCLSLMKEQNGL